MHRAIPSRATFALVLWAVAALLCGAAEAAGPRVAYLEAHAALANWDADPEPDGLRLTLQALDAHGQPVAVGGQLSARLLAEFRTDPDDLDGRPLTQFREVADWMQPVAARDYADGLLVFRLPLDRFDPQIAVAYEPTGWLRVRLGIPGQGVLETDVIDVVLRPHSRIRDHLQLYRGSRLFPGDLPRDAAEPRNW